MAGLDDLFSLIDAKKRAVPYDPNAISPRTTVNNLVPLWNQIVRPF